MAVGIRGLRLWRAAPSGGAGWSECQRPSGRKPRLEGVSTQMGSEAGPGRSHARG